MRTGHLLIIALISLVFLVSGCIQTGQTTTFVQDEKCKQAIEDIPNVIAENTKEDARVFNVSRTIDGDTIELSGGQKVRFLEVNTPEKGMKWYTEASDLTKTLTADGVYLTRDVTDEDKYDRFLRYVFTKHSFVNAELIKEGFATVFIVGNDTKYASLMKCLEIEAKQNKRGIWSAFSKYNMTLFVNYDAPGSDADNLNGEYVVITNNGNKAIDMNGWSIKDEATHIYTFGNTELNPHEDLKLYTGAGQNSELSLYWNSKDPIWNNDGDTAFLFDENGDLIIEKSWGN